MDEQETDFATAEAFLRFTISSDMLYKQKAVEGGLDILQAVGLWSLEGGGLKLDSRRHAIRRLASTKRHAAPKARRSSGRASDGDAA